MNTTEREDPAVRAQRATYIARIAVLSTYVDKLEQQLRAAGVAPVRAPRVDEVRPAILAEGVVAELNRLRAELRLCEQDLAACEVERDELKAQAVRAIVSAAGVGDNGRGAPPPPEPWPLPPTKPPPPPPAEPTFMPAEDDPALKHQQRFLPEAPPAAAAAPDVDLVEEPAPPPPAAAAPAPRAEKPRKAPKPKPEAPAVADVVLGYLTERGTGATAGFIATATKLDISSVIAALHLLKKGSKVTSYDMAGFTQWRLAR